MQVLSFGEIVWDIIDGKHYLGGAPLNFAAHIVKCGGKSSILSSIGKDTLGLKALSEIKSIGVDTSYITVDKGHPTGTVDVFFKNNQPDYEIHQNVAFDFIEPANMDYDSFDVFYLGSLAQRSPLNRSTLANMIDNQYFKHIFYDVNLRKNGYTKEIITTSVARATILKLNDKEVTDVSDFLFSKTMDIPDFTEACASRYNTEVILITAGEKGCYVYCKNILTHIAGEKVEVKDTVGAGDAFSAAFMIAYYRTADPIESAQLANKVGAYVASQDGALPVYSKEIQSIF